MLAKIGDELHRPSSAVNPPKTGDVLHAGRTGVVFVPAPAQKSPNVGRRFNQMREQCHRRRVTAGIPADVDDQHARFGRVDSLECAIDEGVEPIPLRNPQQCDLRGREAEPERTCRD